MAPYASVRPLNPFVTGVSPPKRIDEIGGVSGLFLIEQYRGRIRVKNAPRQSDSLRVILD